MSGLLEVNDLSVTYGGLRAVDHVTMDAQAGMVTGLIGPNGAGKTTFIDAVTGFTRMSSGEVMFDGQHIEQLPPHVRAKRGLRRTFQSLELFEDLTVKENLMVAADRPKWWSVFADIVRPRRDVPGSIDLALEITRLGPWADRFPLELSHGQRKLVGVARALAADPKLVLLDEPAAGLDTSESEVLGERLRELLDHGVSVFLIDHDMSLVLSICDFIWVLDFGKLIAKGTPGEIRRDDRVISAYLGAKGGGVPVEALVGEPAAERGVGPAEEPVRGEGQH